MLRTAIIGTGNIAQTYLEACKVLSQHCQLVALCDASQSSLEKFQQKLGLFLPCYLNHQSLLNSQALDCVMICTPPYTHKEIAIDTLRAGIHVFCEKPMAPSVAECEEMIAAQTESGKLLGICHQNRFRNDIQEVKYIADSGHLGKILFSRIDSFWWRDRSYYDLWWRGTWEKEGGGCLLNHTVHHVDLMLWFLGRPVAMQVLCANQAHDNAEVEDFVAATVQFANNAIAQLTGSVICHGEEQQLYFQYEKGKIVSPWGLYCTEAQLNGFPKGRNQTLEREILQLRELFPRLELEGHAGILANFFKSIEGTEELIVSGTEGKAAVEFITAAYSAAASAKLSPCTIDAAHPWYTYRGILQNAPHFHEKTTSVDSLYG